MKIKLLATFCLGAACFVATNDSQAAGPLQRAMQRQVANTVPWHGAYYDPAWSGPVALVVPPTAERQTKWSWGVTNTDVVPIYHQFRRQWPGPFSGGPGFAPTPYWPGHTDEFGVYYVRGPW
jgi:hypothetical protein